MVRGEEGREDKLKGRSQWRPWSLRISLQERGAQLRNWGAEVGPGVLLLPEHSSVGRGMWEMLGEMSELTNRKVMAASPAQNNLIGLEIRMSISMTLSFSFLSRVIDFGQDHGRIPGAKMISGQGNKSP